MLDAGLLRDFGFVWRMKCKRVKSKRADSKKLKQNKFCLSVDSWSCLSLFHPDTNNKFAWQKKSCVCLFILKMDSENLDTKCIDGGCKYIVKFYLIQHLFASWKGVNLVSGMLGRRRTCDNDNETRPNTHTHTDARALCNIYIK